MEGSLEHAVREPLARTRRSRDVLLLLLAVTAGATDATAFLRLGHVFASVITGNLVVLGASAATSNGRLALLAGCALGGYALGVILAAPRRSKAGEDGPVWPSSATLVLGVTLGLLCAFAILWEIDGPAPARTPQTVMVALCAVAMGVQSTAVRRLGPVSTTYLTGTLTALLEDVVLRRWTPSQRRSVAILLALLSGAAAAAALIVHAHRLLPVLQLLPLVIVEIASVRLIQASG